ncbi:MAG TPA: YqaJ viral recombinase family protein [Stellaceae bacterium]
MALSVEQHARRAGRLGSSDAPRIMAGDWREVWLEKTGRVAPADLDFVPAVQIGVATEHLHARFFERRTGVPCRPAGDQTFVHAELDFLVAHLDFLTWSEPPATADRPPDTILEAKFHGGPKSEEELAAYYYWQVQHQLSVTGLRGAVLSILRPSSYSFVPVPRSERDIATLIETERAFWWHVENDIEPTADPLAVPPPDFETMRIVDMSLHNEFMSLGSTLVEHRAGMLAFKVAETEIKALMPEDARVAYLPPPAVNGAGAGSAAAAVVLSRSKDGRLSLKFGDLPRKYRDRSEPWMPAFAAAIVASGDE